MYLNKLGIIGAAKDKLLCGPKSIYIDITTACNINCNFCWIHSPLLKVKPYKKHLNMDLRTIKHVIDTACEWKSEDISLAGDGEPTIHPQIREIIEYVKEKRIRLYLATNATFQEDLLLTIAKVDHLYVNLCSPDETSYRKFQAPHSKGLHLRVTKNLKVLAALQKKRRGPFLNIAFIINKTNYAVIPQMLNYCDSIGINEATFRVIETTPDTEKIALSPADKNKLKGIIEKTLGIKRRLTHNLGVVNQALENYELSEFNIRSCYTGWFNILVDFNKNIGLCCHNENLIVGNLKRSSLKDIWKSKRSQQLRLQCKYAFDLQQPPFKNECNWCHWNRENLKIQEEIKKIEKR